MAVPQAKRKANNEWDKKNMATLGCKVKKEQADKFKDQCKANNTTANEVLKKTVLDYIGEKPE